VSIAGHIYDVVCMMYGARRAEGGWAKGLAWRVERGGGGVGMVVE